jgi:hypothetical protein
MAEPHVIGALRSKRSELAGMVMSLERQLVQHRASLTHLDATMRLFDPELRPEEIPSRQRRTCNALCGRPLGVKRQRHSLACWQPAG